MLPYEPKPELRKEDFKHLLNFTQHDFTERTLNENPNESVMGRFAKIGAVDGELLSGYSKVIKADRISTAEELFEAGNSRAANRAGKNIDEGREAYLFNLELASFDMHPFASVNDVIVEKRGDCIGLDLGGKLPVYVTPDTLIVWRG